MKTHCTFLLSICFLLISQSLTAAHLLGGFMNYECTAPGQYNFTLTIYRDGNCVNCAEYRDGELLSKSHFEFQVFTGFFGFTDLDESAQQSIALFPNPASNKVHVEAAAPISINQYQIKDLNGRLLTSADFPPFGEISVHHLPKGIYFIQLKSDDTTFTKRFVVE